MHTVQKGEILPQKEKVEAIKIILTSINKINLREFLGQ